jgi:hypothetical protein
MPLVVVPREGLALDEALIRRMKENRLVQRVRAPPRTWP